MWAVALRNGHESFHFVRNGSESFLYKRSIKAASTWVVGTYKHEWVAKKKAGGESRAHRMKRER